MAAVSDFIDGERLWQRLMQLARFGETAEGGVDRPALSETEIAARAQLVAWADEIGLDPYTDSLANLFLRLEGEDPNLPPLLIGSHIDSQPTGGRFDGVYGVLAALEVAEAFKSSGIVLKRAIEVVAWTNEEGSRFAPGMMGSAGYAGLRSVETIHALRDGAGTTAGEAIERVLAHDRNIPQRSLKRSAFGYIEAHIEQGPILENLGIPLGIVTGIQGKRTFRVTVKGEENHAGTSPRSVRKDALVTAIAIIDALQKAVWDREDVVRFTIGHFAVSPNAPSVVPARVEFSIDLRHPDADTLIRLGDLVAPIAKGHTGPCAVEVTQLLHDAPLVFAEEMRDLLARVASASNFPAIEIASGAGHDARHLHAICPTGMLFIPCWKGVSHHPSERIESDHALAGAKVLAQAVERLVG
ncbi:allantoate amidohydrolase [Nitratireductor indicus C115]|uniref:Allantoate amidohydrolase n=1 Tax=Nitratireductor indicus C115 TaxID=1231190 RepID=K2NQ33_9HYPH|nr:M20 family metallo-hydrolase [Nitratireductor indicus]EKF39974.1 allantoate amidohydrolase [Nitratireductor indicus C115]SFQ81737.1 N-carbamoyl-L-amino-acid hydrolase [Nitratireductor indicus]